MSFNETDPLASDLVVESELSDSALLAQALRDATDAYAFGELLGPALDEEALWRATERARRADSERQATSHSTDEEVTA